jgi:formyl-CoA transferase
MLDAMASLLTFNAGIYFATGQPPRRRGNGHPTISPYETFEAADGWFNIGAANDKFWDALCVALGRIDLQSDPRFRRAPDRAAHRPALKSILDPIFREETCRRWVALLSEAGIPCGEIKTVADVCGATQFVERGMVRKVHHPTAGDVRYIASAIRFDDRVTDDAVRPPRLGEHTSQVLSEWLGLNEAQAEAYTIAGAFGPRAQPASISNRLMGHHQ